VSAFRPALVVIDVQRGFVNAGSAHVVPVVADLAARWADAGGPVVFTRYRNHPGSAFERLIGWTRLQDEAEIELVPELAVLADRAVVADKTGYTALTPQVAALAAEHGWTDLFLCGIDTASCVLITAAAVFEAGLTPWVVADACASNATSVPPEEAHAAGLMLIRRLVGAGQVITAAGALARLPVAAGEAGRGTFARLRGTGDEP
jgi:nicotinamidase-related amidase